MKLFSTKEAAKYLDITERMMKKYVHGEKSQNIPPLLTGGTLVAHTLVFTQEQLDTFKATVLATRRGRGRPRKDEAGSPD
jgi:hypothetical protein